MMIPSRVHIVILFVGLAIWACDQSGAGPHGAAPGSVVQSTMERRPLGVTQEGDDAPQILLKLHDGTTVDLAEENEGFLFVYFYPKDGTPGCTAEATGLRDNYEALTGMGVKVIGISLQDATSHTEFIEKNELPFALAVDDGSAADAFGVPYNGQFAARQSFLVKDGKIAKIWRTVRPKRHAEEVLAAIKSLNSGA